MSDESHIGLLDTLDAVLFDLDGTLLDTAPDLVGALLERINRERERKLRGIAPAALEALEGRVFQGNLRELENSLRSAALSTPEEIIREMVFPTEDAR